MSYARFSKQSDVYVYLCCYGYLECCACALDEPWRIGDTDAMLAHLRRHIEAGHTVPDDTIEALEYDREKNDSWMASYEPEPA